MRLLLLGLLTLAACADAPAPTEPQIEVRALYIEPAYNGEAIFVHHEAIPGRMPAMRMAFRLFTPALLDSLTEGAKVTMTLDSASLEVVNVREISFETILNLEDGDENGVGGMILPEE